MHVNHNHEKSPITADIVLLFLSWLGDLYLCIACGNKTVDKTVDPISFI